MKRNKIPSKQLVDLIREIICDHDWTETIADGVAIRSCSHCTLRQELVEVEGAGVAWLGAGRTTGIMRASLLARNQKCGFCGHQFIFVGRKDDEVYCNRCTMPIV